MNAPDESRQWKDAAMADPLQRQRFAKMVADAGERLPELDNFDEWLKP